MIAVACCLAARSLPGHSLLRLLERARDAVITRHAVSVTLAGWAKEDVRSDYVVFASTHIDPANSVALRSKIAGLETDCSGSSSDGGIVVNAQFEVRVASLM